MVLNLGSLNIEREINSNKTFLPFSKYNVATNDTYVSVSILTSALVKVFLVKSIFSGKEINLDKPILIEILLKFSALTKDLTSVNLSSL